MAIDALCRFKEKPSAQARPRSRENDCGMVLQMYRHGVQAPDGGGGIKWTDRSCTLVQSLASEERIEGGAWLGKRIATLEGILSGGHLTRDEQIDAAWRAKGVG